MRNGIESIPALPNDSTLHRYPAGSMEYALRLAEKPDKEKKASGEAAFGLYPNPNDGTFILSASGDEGIYWYQITDITGRELLRRQFSKDKGNQIITLTTSLGEGIYLLGLYKPDGSLSGYKRMVVSK